MKTPHQSGMASIIITMVTMLVISLIVLGFATISRREQRQSLDQQLSAQAFYAAESGIEDAKDAIRTWQAGNPGQTVPARRTCGANDLGGGIYPIGDRMKIDARHGVSFTCLKVDPAPKDLRFDGVAANGIVVPIATAQPTRSVEIHWRTTQAVGTPSACPSASVVNDKAFKPQSGAGAWTCGYGLLRLDLVPTDDTVTPKALAGRQLGAYFVPSSTAGGGVLAYASGNLGKANVVQANCNTTVYTECWARINQMNSSRFSLRISSLYQPSDVTIQAFTDDNASSTPQALSGVQVVIDATGKAVDVLRRIQVRLPLINTSALSPGFALNSNGPICKRFSVTGNSFEIPGDIADAGTDNAMCQPMLIAPPDPPCSQEADIVMVLDASNSMTATWQTVTRLAKMRQVSVELANSLNLTPGGHHAGALTFNLGTKLVQPLTSDKATLVNSLNGINNTFGRTNYLDGLNGASAELAARGRAGAQKVIVFMSDGAPDEPAPTIYALAGSLKNQGIRIYTIGITDTTANVQVLKDMAGNGGRFGLASTEAQFSQFVQSIAPDLNCINP